MTGAESPQIQATYTRDEVADLLANENIKFLRMNFTDILGTNKNVEVPTSQFDKALDGNLMFDGSSIQGFVRIEESDMLLQPDFDTFRVYPWDNGGHGKAARLICNVQHPDGAPFEGCPRQALIRVMESAKAIGTQREPLQM